MIYLDTSVALALDAFPAFPRPLPQAGGEKRSGGRRNPLSLRGGEGQGEGELSIGVTPYFP